MTKIYEVDWGGCNGLHYFNGLFFCALCCVCTFYTKFYSLQTEAMCPKIKDDMISVYSYCALWYNKRFHLSINHKHAKHAK